MGIARRRCCREARERPRPSSDSSRSRPACGLLRCEACGRNHQEEGGGVDGATTSDAMMPAKLRCNTAPAERRHGTLPGTWTSLGCSWARLRHWLVKISSTLAPSTVGAVQRPPPTALHCAENPSTGFQQRVLRTLVLTKAMERLSADLSDAGPRGTTINQQATCSSTAANRQPPYHRLPPA